MLSTLHTRLRAHRAPGIPRALFSEGARTKEQTSRKKTCCEIADSRHRHCEEHLRRSNPAFFLAASKLDCFVAIAPRNDGRGCLKIEFQCVLPGERWDPLPQDFVAVKATPTLPDREAAAYGSSVRQDDAESGRDETPASTRPWRGNSLATGTLLSVAGMTIAALTLGGIVTAPCDFLIGTRWICDCRAVRL